MLLKWFPWRWLVRRLARAHGLLDPLQVLARMENLSQPSEVAAPIELLRAGVALHARGVINGKVIQQNLDWVWPYWVNRQFSPRDAAFIPRGFSFAQVNLSHRNWTAVGLPGCEAMPIVDPRGLVTPFFDGWSLDAWLLTDTGESLFPSRRPACEQQLLLEDDRLAVRTRSEANGFSLASEVHVAPGAESPLCRIRYEGSTPGGGWLALALRPLNPEGVGLVERIEMAEDDRGWEVDAAPAVRFDTPASRNCCSTYHEGDVAIGLLNRPNRRTCRCKVGMATAAALFPADEAGNVRIEATVDLSGDRSIRRMHPRGGPEAWPDALQGAARLDVPDERFRFLYGAALRTVVLLSPEDVYPGPYTYKRFWFRDAAIILHAMLCMNLVPRVRRAVELFPLRQRLSGYFHSQSGEWDSNGQVLWLLGRLRELTGRELPGHWLPRVRRGAKWIRRKRTSRAVDEPHAGLLPAGFSAEHLGTNDYYYWDDFWSIAGLQQAAGILSGAGHPGEARRLHETAGQMSAAVDRSLERTAGRRAHRGIPASPYRRMDSGAVGSIACSYPLALWAADDERLAATLDFLLAECMLDDQLFLDIAHSGKNAYLTLSIAQAMLRAEDPRFFPLVCGVAGAASPTGQWPEAIHPHTGGGCMGDGQHAWAAAEWLMMMRSLFVREEAGRLILCSGIPRQWLRAGRKLSFGPTPTPHGPVSVRVEVQAGRALVSWEADWRGAPPAVEARLAGRVQQPDAAKANSVTINLNRGEAGP